MWGSDLDTLPARAGDGSSEAARVAVRETPRGVKLRAEQSRATLVTVFLRCSTTEEGIISPLPFYVLSPTLYYGILFYPSTVGLLDKSHIDFHQSYKSKLQV